MALERDIPGVGTFVFEHLLLDLNGTTTRWGELDDGVVERLRSLAGQLTIHLLSADTYAALGAADVLCGSMVEALDLLLHRSGLAATLRP